MRAARPETSEPLPATTSAAAARSAAIGPAAIAHAEFMEGLSGQFAKLKQAHK